MNRAVAIATVLGVGLAGCLCAASGTSESVVTVMIDQDGVGPQVSKDLYGLFLEDISLSVDGCLYPELVWNRGFDFAPTNAPGTLRRQREIQGWSEDFRNGSAARVSVGYAKPKFENTPAYLRVEAFGPDAGVCDGFAALILCRAKSGMPEYLSTIKQSDHTNNQTMRSDQPVRRDDLLGSVPLRFVGKAAWIRR